MHQLERQLIMSQENVPSTVREKTRLTVARWKQISCLEERETEQLALYRLAEVCGQSSDSNNASD